MTAHLPQEHLLVKVNTMHANCTLEGAFLCWDDATPTCWMYSFRLDQVMRISDPEIHPVVYPFLDPSILVNAQDLTDGQVLAMHEQDIKEAVNADGNDTASTG